MILPLSGIFKNNMYIKNIILLLLFENKSLQPQKNYDFIHDQLQTLKQKKINLRNL